MVETIADVLGKGEQEEEIEYIDQLSPVELEAFQYASITSCDVERTFSSYKQFLGDLRRSFVFVGNLKKPVIIYCNNFEISSM